MHPKGPLPSQVYWRRRLLVIGIIVLVIVVIVIIIAARGGGSPAPTESPGSSAPGSSAPSDEATGASGDACDTSKVKLTADTDKDEYGSGELPQLWLTLENDSAQPCVMQVGGAALTYIISSPSGTGDEVYWSSADCANAASTPANPVTLKPGVPVESSAKVTWPRTRSTPGDCTGTGKDQVGSDGASFDFAVHLGDLSATKRIYLS